MTDASTIPRTMSGYDLAKRVLDEDELGGIAALLELSGNGESDWLELKAGMRLLPEDERKGDKQNDLYWNIAKAVLELMNTSGGALIVGIDDKHNVVPLRLNDPLHVIRDHGMEGYLRREIIERIWPDNKNWGPTKNKETWAIKDVNPATLPELEPYGRYQYQNEKIAVVLVPPADPPIRVWKNDEVELILKRKRGEIGECEEIKGGKQMDDYAKTRRIKDERYSSLYNHFCKRRDSKSKEAELNCKIEKYYNKFEASIKARKTFDFSCFSDLEALGEVEVPVEPPEKDDMATRAVEWGEDDSWLVTPKNDDVYSNGQRLDNDDKEEDDDENDKEMIEKEERVSCCREKRSGDLLELMNDIPRIAIFGEPGGGKTTALMRFALKFHEPENRKQVLAFFIPMGQWQDGDSLKHLLEKRITDFEPDEWQELIKTQRLRLVIDAVNECPDSLRKNASQRIQSFLDDYRDYDIPVVISARTEDDLKYLNWPTFHVLPMDGEHQLNYLVSYLNEEQAQHLYRCLGEMPGGEKIAENPMLLRLVVEVYKTEGKLPAGRAGLYHRWIEQWYRRESGKARKPEDQLPRRFDKALEILSELAFQSRRHDGHRDIPKEVAESILRKYGADCIERLCQGPVVTEEDDSILFRHETFQEYLCAEYLIRHPDDLPPLTKDDPSLWGMPLAYASELCCSLSLPLPEELWRAAWKTDPWFGLAITDDSRMEQAENFIPEKNTFLLHAWSICTQKKEDEHFYIPTDLIVKDRNLWYSKNDPKLGYVILTKENVRKRWFRIELILLSLVNSAEEACIILSRSIALKQYAGQSIDKTFRNILEAGKGLGSASFTELRDRILTETNISNATRLIRDGFASKDDFRHRIAFWIQDAGINEAGLLIAAGLATKEDFTVRIMDWKKKAVPQTAILLIQNKFASKEDFSDKIEIWKQKANPEKAGNLIRNKLITMEEIMDKIDKWKSDADPKMAHRLIRNGFASKADFKDNIDEWKSEADPQLASVLIRTDFASKEDFRDRIGQWILEADPKMARFLIWNRFATKEDFKTVIKKWKREADPKKAYRLMRYGFAIPGDFKDRIEKWISGADKKTASLLIQNGLASKDRFSSRFDNLIDEDYALKKTFQEITAQWKLNPSSHGTTQVICDETALSNSISSNLIPFLEHRGEMITHSEIQNWIKEWIQDPNGFLWGNSVSVPRIGDVYQVIDSNESEEMEDGGFRTRYTIGDCHGYIISSSKPLTSPFSIRVTGIKGLVCFGDVVPMSPRKRKGGRLDRMLKIYYSAKGITGLLEQFVNTGAASMIAFYSNEELRMTIPQGKQIPASKFRLQPVFIPETPGPSDYAFATDCDVCAGDGVLICDYCDGNEVIKCRECDGTGEDKCVKCNGLGHVNCRKCNGLKVCRGKQGVSRTCSVCQGFGIMKCNMCNGSGHLKCDSCDGTGEKQCPACSGKGIKECAVCRGRSAVSVELDRKTQWFYQGEMNSEGAFEDNHSGFIPTSNVYLFVEDTAEKTVIHGSWDTIISAIKTNSFPE